MKKLLVIASLAVSLFLSSLWVTSHPHLKRVDSLQSQLASIQQENEDLFSKNQSMRRRIIALKSNLHLAERRSRNQQALALPAETIFHFQPTTPQQTPITVIFSLSNSTASIAGRSVDQHSFSAELDRISANVPNAAVKLQFEHDLNPLRKQIFLDILANKSIHILP